jgi:DNA-binding transcriptional regulator YhcF (GntR family)
MTDTPKKLIVDVATGTQTYVDLTPEEIAQRDADNAAFVAAEAERVAAEEAANAAAESAKAKLSTLGLTPEEIAALSK